jgi:hypothetical protein
MNDVSLKVMEIFWDALECAPPAEQTAYLERACGGDGGARGKLSAFFCPARLRFAAKLRFLY